MIKIIGIMCAVVTLSAAGPLAVQKTDFSRVFVSALSLSNKCETARQTDRLKNCIQNAATNMDVLLGNINAWYQEDTVNRLVEARQKTYPAICCTIRDMKSCVLTITKDTCTKDEQNQVIAEVEEAASFTDNVFQSSTSKNVRVDCNLFDQTCSVNIDDDHQVTPSQEPLPSYGDVAVKETAVDIRVNQKCRNTLSSKAVPQCQNTIKSSQHYAKAGPEGQCCVSWDAVDCLIDIAFDDCTDDDIAYLIANVKNNLQFNRIDCTKYDYRSQTCGGKHAGQSVEKHNDNGSGGGAGSVSASLFLSFVVSALLALLRN